MTTITLTPEQRLSLLLALGVAGTAAVRKIIAELGINDFELKIWQENLADREARIVD